MIEFNQVSFEYGSKPVFEDFSLRIMETGVHGLFGRNGSGKSTLLKLIAGLLFPQQGEVSVLGFQPFDRLPDFLASVYIVPEEFHLPNISLQKLLATQAGFYPNFSHQDFSECVQLFDIPMDKGFESMSLGQKKKAVIAFALATHTPVLLMDEPTNGLDILGRAQFKTLMARPAQANRVVIISTHQAHDLETLMSHVLFVDDGKLVLSADMATLQRALRMGVSDSTASLPGVIYHEQLGQQTAYVAANTHHDAAPINLELLYKALSLEKAAVLSALDTYKNTKEATL